MLPPDSSAERLNLAGRDWRALFCRRLPSSWPHNPTATTSLLSKELQRLLLSPSLFTWCHHSWGPACRTRVRCFTE